MLAAALIVFREVLEIGLVVGIVLAATRGVAGAFRAVLAGVAAGLLGALLVAASAGRIAELFDGSGGEAFGAAVLLVAVAMLAWHNAWMASHGRAMAADLRAVGRAVGEGARPLAALTLVVAAAMLREGSEVVLFLYGITASGTEGPAALLAGGAAGLAAGAAISALVYGGLLAVPTRRLFAVTGTLITLLAAGMASGAVALLQQGGWLAVLDAPLWNSGRLLSTESLPGRVAHVLVGYTDQPSGLQVIAWLATVALFWALAAAARPTATVAHAPVPAGAANP